MIRPFTCVCMLLAAGSGLYLYQTKHRAQLLDREIARTFKQIDLTHDRIGALKAEWALLNEPDRLKDLAQQHTGLRPLAPTQFVALNDLPSRLPAPLPPSAPVIPADDAATTQPLLPGPVPPPPSVPVASARSPAPPRAYAAADKPFADRPAPEKPAPEKPAPEKPGPEKLGPEKPTPAAAAVHAPPHPAAAPVSVASAPPPTAQPSFAPPTAQPSFAPPTAQPSYAPPTAQPSFAPPTAQPSYTAATGAAPPVRSAGSRIVAAAPRILAPVMNVSAGATPSDAALAPGTVGESVARAARLRTGAAPTASAYPAPTYSAPAYPAPTSSAPASFAPTYAAPYATASSAPAYGGPSFGSALGTGAHTALPPPVPFGASQAGR